MQVKWRRYSGYMAGFETCGGIASTCPTLATTQRTGSCM